MNTKLTPVPARSPVVSKEGGNIAVTALLPEEMMQCQSALIQWAERKIAELESDATELRSAVEHARAHKWKMSTLQGQLARTEKRVVFYGKLLIALQHGYVIVPNFPVQLFAIRTAKKGPKYAISESKWNTDFKQSSQALPIGEGKYQNPFPLHDSTTWLEPTAANPKATRTQYYPTEWDELDFPVSMAKPQIMEAATRAMALGVFDQLGILPAARKEDPIIVAQIKDPRDKWGNKVVTFMIAWHLDTRIL